MLKFVVEAVIPLLLCKGMMRYVSGGFVIIDNFPFVNCVYVESQCICGVGP